jgi:hypothetical protein
MTIMDTEHKTAMGMSLGMGHRHRDLNRALAKVMVARHEEDIRPWDHEVLMEEVMVGVAVHLPVEAERRWVA